MTKGDLITPLTEQAVGLLGSTAIIPLSGKYIQSQDIAKIICHESNLQSKFAYYLISSKCVKTQLSRAAQQTKIRHTSPEKIKDCTVYIPPLEEQKKIAGTLALIDRKIELCEAQNRTLEKLARQIYDYWFVQFDFPDENGKPYKSSGGKMVYNEKLKREIPEGWEVGNICKIAEILSGGTPSKKVSQYWNGGTIPFFGPTDCDEHIFQIQTEEAITEEGLSHCASSLLDFGTIIITARGSIGKLVIVGTPMAMNQSCYALKSTKGEFEYLYFISIQLIELLKKKGSGSVFKSIITPDIENSMLLIGCEKLNSKFCAMVNPCFSQIFDNQKQIQTLTSLRERLLPLLMNGQVEVCD